MRIVELVTPGEEPDFREREVDRPRLADDDIAVRVSACAVCGHDALVAKGELPTKTPSVLGHEIAGTVEAIGSEVHGIEPGVRVVLNQRVACGSCRYCATGHDNLCTRGLGFYGEDHWGGFGEIVRAKPTNVVPIESDLSFEIASLATCAVGTGLHALGVAKAEEGESIVIIGASGGVGVHAIQLANLRGLHVVGVTQSDRFSDTLLDLGCDYVVKTEHPNWDKHVCEVLGGSADIVIDCVGTPTLSNSMNVVGRQGRLIVVGNVTVGTAVLNVGATIMKEIAIRGSGHATADETKAALDFLTHGHIEGIVACTRPHLSSVAAAAVFTERPHALGRQVLVK